MRIEQAIQGDYFLAMAEHRFSAMFDYWIVSELL
jgi:hypothetical protein